VFGMIVVFEGIINLLIDDLFKVVDFKYVLVIYGVKCVC